MAPPTGGHLHTESSAVGATVPPTMARLLVTLALLVLLLLGAVLCTRAAGTEGDRRELLDVLHNVLEKLQNTRMGVWERKTSRLPVCYIGDFCSVKKGSRFGQLCDCPQGTKCNFFFLKCL